MPDDRQSEAPSSGREGHWARYRPSAEAPWDLRRVVHLHRRAGFAASWPELQRDLVEGPEASLDRLLRGQARAGGAADTEEFERLSGLLADAAVASREPGRLKAWWVYRMLFGPDPLGERLTLMWHNHFATSNLKVDDPAAMLRQNQILRKRARAPFGELLAEVVRDPALLVWLDAPANRKGHPNENLARELMELFTLGIGHYSEADVKEAARALTGWTVSDDAFRDVPARRDDGDKTILGRAGRWAGDGLVRMLLDQPATAGRLAWRVCDQFLGEGAVGASAVTALAEGLRRHSLDIGWAVETVLRSREFFAESNLQARVLEPAAFVVGQVRALDLCDEPPSTLVLADWSARLGQDLFYPPNVGGWAGGRAWLDSRTVIGRANFAAALVRGPGIGRTAPLDALGLAARHGRGRDREAVIGFYGQLLLGADPGAGWLGRIASAVGPETSWGPDPARRAVALMVASPEYQIA